jgi:hypothetical protein
MFCRKKDCDFVGLLDIGGIEFEINNFNEWAIMYGIEHLP